MFFILFLLESSAHTVVLSEYKLKYEKDGWTLYFQQKTRSLRDAIYTINPDLKGISLNSEAFLKETSMYIFDNFTLSHDNKVLKIIPKYMKYDGRNFEGQFLVKDLPEQVDYLTIKTSDFDTHEHSIKILSIVLNDQEYLYNFSKSQKEKTFSFESKQYISSKDKEEKGKAPKEGFSFLIYIVGIIILLILAIIIVSKNRESKS